FEFFLNLQVGASILSGNFSISAISSKTFFQPFKVDIMSIEVLEDASAELVGNNQTVAKPIRLIVSHWRNLRLESS
ncbi:unnamed protein product, partial [Allacma fusca]